MSWSALFFCFTRPGGFPDLTIKITCKDSVSTSWENILVLALSVLNHFHTAGGTCCQGRQMGSQIVWFVVVIFLNPSLTTNVIILYLSILNTKVGHNKISLTFILNYAPHND